MWPPPPQRGGGSNFTTASQPAKAAAKKSAKDANEFAVCTPRFLKCSFNLEQVNDARVLDQDDIGKDDHDDDDCGDLVHMVVC